MGGSIAGLLAARVLSEHFDSVTVLERDSVPNGDEARKGVPQGQQPHALLARGHEVLRQLFPDITDALRASGAVFVNIGTETRWYAAGGYRTRDPQGLTVPFMTRPLLERLVRERVAARPNVELCSGWDVRGLVTTEDRHRIVGVRVRQAGMETEETLTADLVIDATGRGSRTPAWLEELGYPRPQEDSIRVNIGYTTLLYPRKPGDLGGAKAVYVTPDAPREKRVAAIFPIEGDRWIVSLGGWVGDHAPSDVAGFQEFARTLPVPDVAQLIASRQPLSDFRIFKFPHNLRRRYEKLTRFPERYLVLGDALCSFNPIYGQGMTSSALTALALDECLREYGLTSDLTGLARPFFQKAARRVEVPWRMAAGSDFAFPGVEGARAPGTDLLNVYLHRLQKATHTDPVVYNSFTRVIHMLDDPKTLLAPGMILRVLRASFGKRTASHPSSLVPASEPGT